MSEKMTASAAREMAGDMRDWQADAEGRVKEAEKVLQRARADVEMWRKCAVGMDELAEGLPVG